MKCASCGFLNLPRSKNCEQCGADLKQDGHSTMFNPHDKPTRGHEDVVEQTGPSEDTEVLAAPPVEAPTRESQAPAGTELDHQVCKVCGWANENHMRFCAQCGSALEAPANDSMVTQKGPYVPARAPRPAPGAITDSPPGPPGPVPGTWGDTPRTARDGIGEGPPPSGVARIVIVHKDGSDGDAFPLPHTETDLGAHEGEILIPQDPYLCRRHARFQRINGGWQVTDLESVNGIYFRIRDAVTLQNADMIIIGQQVLRFETLRHEEMPLGPASQRGVLVFGTPEVARMARLVQYTTEGVGRNLQYLYRDETVLGRETGDVVYPEDPFMSRKHAAIIIDRGAQRPSWSGATPHKFTLRDLESSNGTFVRIRGTRRLSQGDFLRIGRHLFRFETGTEHGAA